MFSFFRICLCLLWGSYFVSNLLLWHFQLLLQWHCVNESEENESVRFANFDSNPFLFKCSPSKQLLLRQCPCWYVVCVVERGHSLRLISLNWRQTKWKWKIKLNFRDTHCALFCFVFGLLCDCVLIHWHWCCRYHLFLPPGYEVLSLRVVRVDIFNGVVVSDLIC